jgi:hypothetical protein
MPKDRLENLYEHLTSREKATLAFTHLSALNAGEADRVRATVPMKVYRTLDEDHVNWVSALQGFAMLWALIHWQEFAGTLAALGRMTFFLDRGDDDRAAESFDAWVRGESRLLALNIALESACAEHGIDPEAVRRIAGVDGPYKASGPAETDADYLAEMTAAFANLLRIVQ